MACQLKDMSDELQEDMAFEKLAERMPSCESEDKCILPLHQVNTKPATYSWWNFWCS